MQGLVYDKNLVNATKRSAAHSGVSDKQKQGHCFPLSAPFLFPSVHPKVPKNYLLPFPFKDYLPDNSIRSPAALLSSLTDCLIGPNTCATSRANLKVSAQESFSSKNVSLIAMSFNLSSIKIESLSRDVNQRKSIQSTVSSAKTKNLTQGPTSTIRIEFWSICIHICTYWFASVVIPCLQNICPSKISTKSSWHKLLYEYVAWKSY